MSSSNTFKRLENTPMEDLTANQSFLVTGEVLLRLNRQLAFNKWVGLSNLSLLGGLILGYGLSALGRWLGWW